MKVGFLFLHPFSGSLGSTVRVRELAISLHRLGVDCFILSPFEKNHRICEGVDVVSMNKWVQAPGISENIYKALKLAYYNRFFASNFLSSRKLQNASRKAFVAATCKILKEIDVDIIQTEQDVTLPIAVELKRKTDLPVLVDLHNITSEELVAAGAITRGSNGFNALQSTMEENLELVDSVVVVSEEMKKYVIANYHLRPTNVVVVPPGGRIHMEGMKKKHPPPKMIYSGLVAYREHVDLFVKSMPLVQEKLKSAEFYITKKGEALNKIRRLAKELGASPTFFWYPHEKDFFEFLSSCHIGVLPSSSDLPRKMGTPVKLFDYLSAGLPVVANDVGSWTTIIKDEKVGIVTEDNAASFASGILELAENKKLLTEYGHRSLDLIANKYNWDKSASNLLETCEKLVGK
jgi:glycosyltransferase involved in cell wall biosynthesis